MTWSDFKSAVRDHLHVHSVRAGIQPLINRKILTGVIEVQDFVPLYREGQTTTYQADDFTTVGQASVAALPEKAMPRKFEYVGVGNQCNRHPLDDYPYENLEDLVCGNVPVTGCRYRVAMDPYGKTFYIFPSVQEGDQVVLQWDGLKSDFEEDDEVPFDETMAEVVAEWVLITLALVVDKNQAESDEHKREYARGLRNLFLRAKDRRRQRDAKGSPVPVVECAPVVTPIDDTEIEVVLFGDSGDTADLDGTVEVAALVNGTLNPDCIIHLGDANLPDGDPVQLQDAFTEHYHGWISDDLLYLAMGNHDIETDGGAAIWALLDHLAALNSGKTYYAFTKGEVNFFVLDTQSSDGITAGSVQGAWLQAQLAAATSGWNVVCMHEAPYTSEESHTPGNVNLRWPFKDWGADLVIAAHAHNYERLLVDGLPYLNCGLGGNTIRDFADAPVAGSQYRYNARHGVLKLVGSESRLQVSLVNTLFEIVDELVLRT